MSGKPLGRGQRGDLSFISATQKEEADTVAKPPCKEFHFHMKTLGLHTGKSSCFPGMDFRTFGSDSILLWELKRSSRGDEDQEAETLST